MTATPIQSSVELPERIRRLRTMRRWDQGELARRAGFSATTVSQIERGRIAASAAQVESISAALGYSSAFVAADRGMISTTRPLLRAYADASKREADARLATATTLAEYIRSANLKPFADLTPYFDGDLDDDAAIEDAAKEARELARLGEDDVVKNAILAAERLGCVVIPLESEMGRHMGMSVRADKIPIICVANSRAVPGDRQRFTVAHELGHLVLHAQTPPPGDSVEASRLEKQANRFAAAFLAPGTAVIETLNELGGRVTLNTLAEVKAVWGVSIKALVGRFRSLGVIDSDQARSLYKQISARRWSTQEPVEVPLERAQWLRRSLELATGLPFDPACDLVAEQVGGNAADLRSMATWDLRSGDVIDLNSYR